MDTARRDREGIFSGGRTRVYHVEENKDVQMKTAWQIDDQGNHRVVVNGTAGEWAGYNHVSRLTVGTDVYVGFSSFWEGALPVEQVLKLQKVHAINEILQGTRPEKI